MNRRLSVAEALLQAHERGLIVSDRGCAPLATTVESEPEPAKPLLLPSCHMPPSTWVVGVQTRSVANVSEWKKRSNHTKQCREAVSKCFGPTLGTLALFAAHYHEGKSVHVTFTRLAPRRLDAGNVSVALKAVEDALALLMGANDGDVRWLAKYEQEQSERYGVRIEMGYGL